VLRLSAAGATLESHFGLFGDYGYTVPAGLLYAGGAATVGTGEVVDLTDPNAPLPAGRFPVGAATCTLASRSATRVMMFCPSTGAGSVLHMLDSTSFTRTGSATLPVAQSG